jgi:hypothetical protein
MILRIIVHVTEREGQTFLCSQAGQCGKKLQKSQAYFISLWKFKTFMQEQILMSYTDLRNRGTEQEISQPGQ